MELSNSIQQLILEQLESSRDIEALKREIQDTSNLIDYALNKKDKDSIEFVETQKIFLTKCKELKIKLEKLNQ